VPLINAATPFQKGWQMTGAAGRTLCVQVLVNNVNWFPNLLRILTGFALFPYQTLGSSNGVTGALDGVNRINGDGDVVGTLTVGAARSWWVGLNPSTGVAWCIHDFSSGEIVYSNTNAFTGGSATARPTAVDEVPLSSAVFNTFGATQPKTICVWHSNDGKQTMFVAHGSSFGADSVCMQWFFGDVHNAPATWDHPTYIAVGIGEREGLSSHTLSGSGGGLPSKSTKPTALGGGIFSPYFQVESCWTGVNGEPVAFGLGADASGNRYAEGMALFVNTSGFFGTMGCWPDVLCCGIRQSDVWSAFAGVGVGTNGNSPDSSRSRCLIGTLLYPWDGGAWSV
jgi:hypothetical protein